MGFLEMSQQILFLIENSQSKAKMNQNVNIWEVFGFNEKPDEL